MYMYVCTPPTVNKEHTGTYSTLLYVGSWTIV